MVNRKFRPINHAVLALISVLLVLASCNKSAIDFDASGTFEAKEIIISAEAGGKLLDFLAEEGSQLSAGDSIGRVDCANLSLQKQQVEASVDALQAKTMNVLPQINVLEEQINTQQNQVAVIQTQISNLEKEKIRIGTLVKAEAAPTRQLDELDYQLNVLQKQLASAKSQIQVLQAQIKATRNTTSTQNSGVLSEQEPLKYRIAQIEDQLGRCVLVNPVSGTVLTTYVEQYEVVNPGKALYKIADMRTLMLRAYMEGDRYALLKLNQSVTVRVDDGQGGRREYTGKVVWIADEAEFTPKTIQTRDERANLVYALKVQVPNDGFLKLGMFGEVVFNVGQDDQSK